MMSANELRGWFCSILAVLAGIAGIKDMIWIFAAFATAAFVLDMIQSLSKRHDR